MSNRRKDMWKLLYNLVNRNSTDLNEVFAFVEDILCKEPSLIRSSLSELNNRFQDTFMLWLINKFVKSLGEHSSEEEIHLKNVKLQQKILTSCLVNRPLLFERLVRCYTEAIEQVAEELPETVCAGAHDDAADSENTQCIEVNAFTCTDACLCEIDVEFTFTVIKVSVDNVDDYAQPLLQILRHALTMGREVYPKLFVNSLDGVFKALKECDYPVKLLCLRYIHELFQHVDELCPLLEYYYELTVRALVLMWEQVPMWLHAECITPDDLNALVEIACVLLLVQRSFKRPLQCSAELLELAFIMLSNTAEIASSLRQSNDVSITLEPVIESLITFMLGLQLSNRKAVMLNAQQCILLLRLVDEHAKIMRLLALVIVQQNLSSTSQRLLKFFKEKLVTEFSKPIIANKDVKYLEELLIALTFIEHHQCLQKQLNYFEKEHQTLNTLKRQNLSSDINLFNTISNNNWTSQLNTIVEKFFVNAEKITNIELNASLIKIAGLLMKTTTLQAVLSIQLQQKLLTYIENPLKETLASMSDSNNNSNNRELAFISLQILCNIYISTPKEVFTGLQRIISSTGTKLFASSTTTDTLNDLRTSFCDNLSSLIVINLIKREQILNDFLPSTAVQQKSLSMMASMLKSVYCTSDINEFHALTYAPYSNENQTQNLHLKHTEIVCIKCIGKLKTSTEVAAYMRKHSTTLLTCSNAAFISRVPKLPTALKNSLCQALLRDETFSFIGHHLELSTINSADCFQILSRADNISVLNVRVLRTIVPKFIAEDDDFVMEIAKFTLQQTLKSLQVMDDGSQQQQQQLQVLELINCCVHSERLSEKWLFHFFKMTFFFLVHPDSQIVHEAVLRATEMCAKHGVQPARLWNWYKRDALSLIVKLAVYIYLKKGVRLTRSLRAFSKMLGFSCVQEFICKYYRLLTTMILPYCVKEPRCKGLIVCISKTTRKPISTLFVVSFLRIYTHIYLTEEAAIGNKCIDLILKCTDFSLKKLMNTDVKQTVSEFLIYFNRNPQFVMKAFQCLLLNEPNTTVASTSSKALTPTSEFAKFIADRFLGVITYFETCLAEPSFEKPLKEEALYSLGQIIRLVGPNHVTQFRFKIIAMLSFVLSLNDRHLQTICLKIWNIFLHIVNIEELGPSLSRIVASLQPLLQHSKTEVNSIYEFIILNNDSLLGTYIPDLYFLESIENVAPAIRQCVSRQTELLKSDRSSLLDKISFFFKQINNENLQVRIYGLSHLRKFIATNRGAINNMVLSEIRVDPLIENVVEVLVAGCRHEDRNLQLASAKCLGELGAIDPSYMPFNYSFEQTRDLPLSVHTDDFAIMALTELCRAYQFQKDTKYVDNFSLAIQETLSVCGVSPQQNKKMNVWEAVPMRMRQVMEPLLTSCYTGSRRESQCKEHPLFNSSFCHSYSEWAFAWASRLIDFVQGDDTKHLLTSYKPSIKRDSNTLAILFPYILLHALQECNETQLQQMYEEFQAVFTFSSRSVTAQPEYETSGMKEFLSTKYSADRNTSAISKKASHADQDDALEHITSTCMKLCSEQIDFLQRWVREWQRHNIVGGKIDQVNQNYKRIKDFLGKFDKYLIAKANYNSGEFARALMYLEEHIDENAEVRLQEQISFLIEIYGNLMDADSVEGAVYKKKCNLTLAEEILVNRIVDRPQETMTCYEQLMSSNEPMSQDDIKGIIDCYLRMDTPETALLIADGLWQKLTDQYTDDYFKECKAELLWRLGSYDELQELLEDSVVRRKTTNWNIQCAEAFLLFRQPHGQVFENFATQLDVIRGNVVGTMHSCSHVKQNSYPHSYDEVVKLHLLNEIEKNKLLLNNLSEYFSGEITISNDNNSKYFAQVQQFLADWDARLCVLQPIVRVMEPVLCFRRNLLIETKRVMCQQVPGAQTPPQLLTEVSELIDNEVGKLWIRSIQMNRDAGCLQQAHLSIMKAEQYKPKTLFIEKAKLLWEKGDQTKSFKLIEENLERIESKCRRDLRQLCPIDRALYAEAKFLQATYNAESMNICAELNLRYFKEAISGNRYSEKCHVQLAQYMEKMYKSFSDEQKDGDNGYKLLLDIMINYAKSLKFGCENVYQSLPRLLSFWLDFTSDCVSLTASASTDARLVTKVNNMKEQAKKMNELINNCTLVLPTSIFYTAFSQLLSRICHPSNEVYHVLRTIFIKLVEHFPHQSLWMLLPILKSSQTNRNKRCNLIFTDSRLAKTQFQKLLADFNMLAERLIELTNKEVVIDQTYGLSTLVKQLPRLFTDSSFSEILLPFEKYMQASFPITSSSSSVALKLNLPVENQDAATNAAASKSSIPSNPFPHKQIFICGIKEEVTVLRSAAKPKKITILCNDGKHYEVMVKPKDDLRKDYRLMEFNGLVKRYLHQDSQARHRRLRIRTYAAIPFNEECGLVEWLPKLNSYRTICQSFYRMRGQGIPDRLLRNYAPPKTDPIEKKRTVFLKTLVPQHPPVFHEWLRQRFPTPHAWYEARCSYVKTIAVMSMVGYILGLGDRHGENVLFDETNGDAVHVDFNCLFNQGEAFQYPELVPFRLTHGMVFAMGPLGVEGMYRKCCEITLRVLKQETITLMSVLRPFVYDLVALNRNYNKKQGELTDPKAMLDVRRIEERLNGYVKRTLANSMPLSTEGQVNFLISEATDIDNLCAMYVGWGSYI